MTKKNKKLALKVLFQLMENGSYYKIGPLAILLVEEEKCSYTKFVNHQRTVDNHVSEKNFKPNHVTLNHVQQLDQNNQKSYHQSSKCLNYLQDHKDMRNVLLEKEI